MIVKYDEKTKRLNDCFHRNGPYGKLPTKKNQSERNLNAKIKVNTALQ